jgi:hypothetical protein
MEVLLSIFVAAELRELAESIPTATKEFDKWKELAIAVGYVESWFEPAPSWERTLVDELADALYSDIPNFLSVRRKEYAFITQQADIWKKRAVKTVRRHYGLGLLNNKIFLDFDAFRVMVQSGMDTEPVFPKGLFNKTVYFDNVEMAKYILDHVPGTNINEPNIMYGINAYTPAMYAVNHLCKEMLVFLANRGAELDVVLRYSKGQTIRERVIQLGWLTG